MPSSLLRLRGPACASSMMPCCLVLVRGSCSLVLDVGVSIDQAHRLMEAESKWSAVAFDPGQTADQSESLSHRFESVWLS